MQSPLSFLYLYLLSIDIFKCNQISKSHATIFRVSEWFIIKDFTVNLLTVYCRIKRDDSHRIAWIRIAPRSDCLESSSVVCTFPLINSWHFTGFREWDSGRKKGGKVFSCCVSSYNPERTKEHRAFHRNNLRRGVTAYHPKTAIPLIAHPRATVRRMGRRTQLWPRQPLSTSGQLFLNLPKVTSCLVGSANTADILIKVAFIKRSFLRLHCQFYFHQSNETFDSRMRECEWVKYKLYRNVKLKISDFIRIWKLISIRKSDSIMDTVRQN